MFFLYVNFTKKQFVIDGFGMALMVLANFLVELQGDTIKRQKRMP